MNAHRKRLKELHRRNIRSFQQKGLLGLLQAAKSLGFPDERGYVCMEMGSSSIIDPRGHVARLKMAMGIKQTHMDEVWAYMGDTNASLYIGFQPGRTPTRIHPQVWLHRFVGVMPWLEPETILFLDKLCNTMVLVRHLPRTSSYPESGSQTQHADVAHIFPLSERTLH